jgi:hypothetical protein
VTALVIEVALLEALLKGSWPLSELWRRRKVPKRGQKKLRYVDLCKKCVLILAKILNILFQLEK